MNLQQSQVGRLYNPALYSAIQAELRLRQEVGRYKSLVMDPSSPFYDILHKKARYKTYWGGRGAAKSWAMAEALIRRASKEPIRWLCTREYQNSIKDSVHRLLKDFISRLGLNRQFHVTQTSITSEVGAEFIFKGLHNNVDEIKSTEGLWGAWVAEAQSTSEDSWQILIPTVRGISGVCEDPEIWADFNMTDENAPSYVRLVTNAQPGTIVHKVNYTENPYFPEVLRREMEYLKKHDYDAYLHVWEGMARTITDAVIFGKVARVEGFPDGLAAMCLEGGGRMFYGLDHGFARDPYALTRSFIYKKKLYVDYEAFGVGVEFAGEMVDGKGELEQLLDTVPGSRTWPIKADSSRPETISFLCNKGFQVSAADKWKGCVEDGIAHIKGFEEVVIHPRCKHMAEEARLYKFKVDRVTGDVLPIVVDKNNHGWDSIRYALDGHIQKGGSMATWAALGATP